MSQKKSSLISSPKVKNFLEAFSLSVWLVIWLNSCALDEKNTTYTIKQTTEQKVEQKNEKSDLIFKELKYNFIEKNTWLISAILEKLKDEWIFKESLVRDLEYVQSDIVRFFIPFIKRNWLELEYDLDYEVINGLKSIKTHLEILINLRYWKWYFNIFDWRDHSNSSLKIVFKKTNKWYIIESLYIIIWDRGDSEKKEKHDFSFSNHA